MGNLTADIAHHRADSTWATELQASHKPERKDDVSGMLPHIPTVSAVLSVLSAAAMFAASAQPPAQPKIANVGIVYEGPDLPLAEGYLGAHYIKNLLGHFGMRGELVRLADYRPGQLVNYRAAFYIGSVTNTRLSESFLKDIKGFHQPFAWLGQHIDQLLADPGTQRRLGFRYLSYQASRNAWRVLYKDTLFPKDNFNLTVVESVQGGHVEVRATAVQSDNTRVPYAALSEIL
jgi:hypothetical protein